MVRKHCSDKGLMLVMSGPDSFINDLQFNVEFFKQHSIDSIGEVLLFEGTTLNMLKIWKFHLTAIWKI